MADSVMREEFPTQKQRTAVCNETWRKAKSVSNAKDDEQVTHTLDAEIFAAGRWNGMAFGRDDLEQIANTFAALGENHKVPLKLGHSEDQDLRNGQPALGWVEDVWVDGNKLMARFVDVPDMVYKSINKGRYRHVSIELDMDVSYKGQHFDYVLSGVALLGADIPAVNTLEDLTAYMGAGETGYSFERQATFTAIGGDEEDDSKPEEEEMAMTAEEKAEFDRLKSSVETLQNERDQFKQTAEAEKAKREELENQQKQAEFSRKKQDFSARLEDLVKHERITPAKRDEVLGKLKEEDETSHEVVEFTVKTLEETFSAGKKDEDVPPTKEQGLAGKTGEDDTGSGEDEPANVQFSRKVAEYQREKGVGYREASRAVGEQHPELLRGWVDENYA
jgi:hypothetical protein